jgi:hypothetical protein
MFAQGRIALTRLLSELARRSNLSVVDTLAGNAAVCTAEQSGSGLSRMDSIFSAASWAKLSSPRAEKISTFVNRLWA